MLLTLAAQTPLLLLFNECVTPSYIKYNAIVPPILIGGTIALQASTIYFALLFCGKNAFAPNVFAATALATWSSLITLIQAQKVMAAAVTGKLSFLRSFALGAIPSTILLLLYTTYDYIIDGGFQEFLLLHLILPALVYKVISQGLPGPMKHLEKPDRRLLQLTAIAGLMVMLLTAINVQVRAELGASVPHYNSIILGTLNIASALFLTFAKAAHLESETESAPFSFWSVLPATAISVLIAAAPTTASPTLATLKFLILQFAFVHALIKLRSIWSVSIQSTPSNSTPKSP